MAMTAIRHGPAPRNPLGPPRLIQDRLGSAAFRRSGAYGLRLGKEGMKGFPRMAFGKASRMLGDEVEPRRPIYRGQRPQRAEPGCV